MKEYLAKKTTGFYLTVLAAILALVALLFYKSAETPAGIVFVLVPIAAVVELVLILGSAFAGNRGVFNLAATVNAVLIAAALVLSFSTQLDYLGWVVSGLYSPNQILSFVTFAAITAVAMLLNVIASYMDLGK